MKSLHPHSLAVLVLFVAACGDPKERKALTALEGLRASLAAPNSDLNRYTDSRISGENLVFARAINIERDHGIHLAESGLDQQMSELTAQLNPRRFWNRAQPFLVPGRCVKIEDVVVPDDLRMADAPRSWPDSVKRRYEAVARRLNGAYAADFRCGDGPRFLAVFTRPDPDDGTWRVAKIDVSLRGP
jgi:hypothetical protein